MGENEIEVRRHNKLIWARYKFGINEQRIMLVILSNIKQQDKDLEDYFVSWSDLKKYTPHAKTRARIESAANKLKAKTIQVKRPGEVDTWDFFGLLSGWTFTPTGVSFRVDEKLKPYLLQIAGEFTLYALKYALALQSRFSIRVYEMLKSEMWKDKKNKEKRRKVVITKAELMDLLGIEEGSYLRKNHALFVKNVLQVCQLDIIAHTDISFIYKCTKTGRFYTHIVFFVKEDMKRQITTTEHDKKEIPYQGQYHRVLDGKEISGWFDPHSRILAFPGQNKETNVKEKDLQELMQTGEIWTDE